jgi:hypothetical protein
VSVSPKHFPVLASRDERNLLDGETSFEKAARAFVTQIVKMKVIGSTTQSAR